MKLKYKIIIPARKNSKRLVGKNLKILNGKPLIQHSIDYALLNFEKNDIWVNLMIKILLNYQVNEN